MSTLSRLSQEEEEGLKSENSTNHRLRFSHNKIQQQRQQQIENPTALTIEEVLIGLEDRRERCSADITEGSHRPSQAAGVQRMFWYSVDAGGKWQVWGNVESGNVTPN